MVRKIKAHVELNLAGDVKANKKGFCKCLSGKIKTRESICHCW